MALSIEERERIREEEWVRAQAREDFKRSTALGPVGQDRFVGIVATFGLVLGLIAAMGLLVRFLGGSGF
jgi:hypothetical protein